MHDHTVVPGLLPLTTMWFAMMTAMMAPVAWPWVHAFQRFGAGDRGLRARTVISTVSFSTGYLTAWLGYSIAAAALQQTLILFGLLDPRQPWSSAASAGILIAAGLYQLAPQKRACLTHCRNPITFFLMRWRNGPAAGFRLGFGHGLYCVGCCWALMLTALVVGMSELWWMLALTAAVFAEQVVPHGHRLRAPLGIALIASGLWRL